MTIIEVGKIEDDYVKKIKEWDELSDNLTMVVVIPVF